MKKKVPFTTKPGAGVRSSDQWVADRTNAAPTKRLTIDVSGELHRRMKVQCAARDEVMADVVRDLLERHFAAGYEEARGASPQKEDGPAD